ncbi:MAG: GTPase Era [Negativicoccus succinicivorans]|uniref:GTPase Era n=1 Tax=Negativicoccus succinicivorans TaxID=620903 RepID=UPI002907E17E|nr:GTPase Era [Negativicoccus succinicivorans]MDU5914797.1 GTPase Era [Negativicoccus succinicivorans]
MNDVFRSGFIALIGRPNVGKSTLLNRILQQKISIVSDKAQTTRDKIMGVYTQPDFQMVFVDTPGIHKPRHKLGEKMRKEALDALNEVDAVLFMVAADERFGPGTQYILDRLQTLTIPVYLAINKIDQITPEKLLPLIDSYRQKFNFTEIVPISARDGYQIDTLLDVLRDHLPEGPQYYPEDMVTDRPERNIMAELIREKILHVTRDEVPHAIGVEMEEITQRENGKWYVRAVIYVERDSQKRIIIGKNGALLRTIGAESRADIEKLMNGSVYLDLWVKVAPDWRNKDRMLKELGYE